MTTTSPRPTLAGKRGDSSALFSQMRAATRRWVELDEPEWRALAAVFHVRTFPRRADVTLPGTARHEVLFVCRGLLRFYYIDEEGRESNKAFIAEDQFAAPVAAATLGLPLVYGVQTLESTTLLAAQYTDFARLFDRHRAFDRLGRRLAEQLLIHKELRTRSLLQQRARERYLDFVTRWPGLAARVPQYHVASYLGITEVSLSRLRRR